MNYVHRLELAFTNITPIDLQIEYINILCENLNENNQQNHINTFKIKLFLNENKLIDDKEGNRAIVLPAKCKNFKIDMFFFIENYFHFKMIGYEFELFNFLHTIYLYDIYDSDSDRNRSNEANSTVQSHYDIEPIPNLPVINDIQVLNQANNSVYKIKKNKTIHINSKLGSEEIYKVEFLMQNETKLDHNSNELSSIKFKLVFISFNVLNEQMINKLSAKIKLINRGEEAEDSVKSLENYFLSINSIDFANFIDDYSNEENLDLNCNLELKYTNQSGIDYNMSHILKIQFVIHFVQVYKVRLDKISDLSENEFDLGLNIKNLLQDNAIVLNNDNDLIEITSKNERKTKIKMDKFSLNYLTINNQFDLNHNIKELLNKHINLESKIGDDKSLKIKFNTQSEFLNYASKIFKCPLRFHLKLSNEARNSIVLFYNVDDGIDKEWFKALLHICDFKFRIKNPVYIKFLSNNVQWCLEVRFLSQ